MGWRLGGAGFAGRPELGGDGVEVRRGRGLQGDLY